MAILVPLFTTYLFQTVMFIASTIMQMAQASAARARQAQMEAEAAARADAAKGVQLSTEGSATALYVCYGRNLVGGNRVYHNTFNNYKHAVKNKGSIIITSGGFDADTAKAGGSGSNFWGDINTHVKNSGSNGVMRPPPSGFDADAGGSKHEYLYYQQALCVAGLSNIIAITVDGSYMSEPKFKNSIKVQVHLDGGVVDSLMAAQVTPPPPPLPVEKTEEEKEVNATNAGLSGHSYTSDIYNVESPEMASEVETSIESNFNNDAGNAHTSSNTETA